MKKIVLAFMAGILTLPTLAQDSPAAAKSFRFGLKASPMVSWYSPDNKKRFESDGSLAKFAWGLQMEFRLNSTVNLVTGLEITYDGGKLNFIDSAFYYTNVVSDEIIPVDQPQNSKTAPNILLNRRYNVTYVTIPLALKMHTKDIGGLTYFGQFGLNTNVRAKARATDQVFNLVALKNEENTDIDIVDDVNLIKLALNVGGGAEYNLSGTTSAFAAFSFNYGFTNALKKESGYVFSDVSSSFSNGLTVMQQNATNSGLVLSVGILF